MRAVVWAGVSSRPQAEKESLADQIQAGRELAAREGWQVVAVLAVPGISRSLIDLADAIAAVDAELAGDNGPFYRAQLAALGATDLNAYAGLKRLIDQRGLDVLICRGRDRVGRTDSLVAGIEERLARVGAFLHSRAMPGTGSRIGDIFSSAIERGMARSEIIQLTEKTRAGHDARARAGLPYALLPFGYTAIWMPEGARMVRRAAVVPGEATAYLWAVAAIQQRNATLEEIGARLAVLFPERAWRPGPLSTILRNPFHAGIILRRRKRLPGEEGIVQALSDRTDDAWRQAVALLAKRAARLPWDSVDHATRQPKLHLIAEGTHEPLIGLAEWLAFQELLEVRAETRRPWGGLSTWAGLVQCGSCGATMIHTERYYSCPVQRRSRGAECGARFIREEQLVAGVAGYLRALFEHEAAALDAPAPAGLADLQVGWERQLTEIAGQRARANLLFVSGRLKTTEEYDSLVARMDKAEAELRAAMAEAQAQIELVIARHDRTEVLTELLAGLEERLAGGEPAELNRWLRGLFQKIVVVDRQVVGVVLA